MTRSDYVNRGGYGALEDLSQDMERVFDSLLGRTVGTVLRGTHSEKYVPALDIVETKEGFSVSVDLPGIDPTQVRVEMHDGKLTIAGKREGLKEKTDETVHRIERSNGSFLRAVSLPSEVDTEQIDASYEHGVLKISLPKVAKQQPKKIQIRTS